MCVAYPGIVTEVSGDTATIDYSGNKVKAKTGIVDVKPGDYALVHAGLAIQVLPENEVKYMTELFKELEELQ